MAYKKHSGRKACRNGKEVGGAGAYSGQFGRPGIPKAVGPQTDNTPHNHKHKKKFGQGYFLPEKKDLRKFDHGQAHACPGRKGDGQRNLFGGYRKTIDIAYAEHDIPHEGQQRLEATLGQVKIMPGQSLQGGYLHKLQAKGPGCFQQGGDQ